MTTTSTLFTTPLEVFVNKQNSQDTQRIISLKEVAWHDSASDCWIIIYDRVYDITDFLDEHPGGCDTMLDYAGRDASLAFRGSGHSKHAISALRQFEIGQLPSNECIFRKTSGYLLTDLPE